MSVDTYFCFCCLSTDGLRSLFGSKTETNFADLLKDLFSVEVNTQDYEDESYVCPDCTEKLRDTLKFRNQVLETLNILQNNGLVKLRKSPSGCLVVQKELDDDFWSEDDFKNKDMYDCKDDDDFQADTKEEPPDSPTPASTNTKPKALNLHPEICLKNEKRFTVTRKKGPKAQAPIRAPEPSYKVPEDLKCRLCGEEQLNIRLFHKHMNCHFPNHICETCGKGYITQKRLRRHMSSHDAVSIKCEACGEVFSNYNTYNSHKQRKHSSVPVYKCPACPQRFETLTRRARHLAAKHGHRADKYQCPLCEQKFLVSGSLSSHMRHTHHKVKRHSCPDCDAGFFHKQELKAHQATHDGVKGFQCGVCTKSYPRKNALVVHMRTHAPDRPFKCDKCRQSFTQKCSLIKHGKLHKGVPLEAPILGK